MSLEIRAGVATNDAFFAIGGADVARLQSDGTLTLQGPIKAVGGTFNGALLPDTTNSRDLGSAAARWRNVYTNDLHLSNGIGDYTVVEGAEELYLCNNKSGKFFKFALIEVPESEVPKRMEQDGA